MSPIENKLQLIKDQGKSALWCAAGWRTVGGKLFSENLYKLVQTKTQYANIQTLEWWRSQLCLLIWFCLLVCVSSAQLWNKVLALQMKGLVLGSALRPHFWNVNSRVLLIDLYSQWMVTTLLGVFLASATTRTHLCITTPPCLSH